MAGVSLASMLQVTGPVFLLQLDFIFNIYCYYGLAPVLSAVCYLGPV